MNGLSAWTILGAALDPILVGVAAWLGWRADQPGKIVIAAIAALGVALLADWLLTLLGIPWFASLSRSGPTLLQVRAVSALLVAAAAYGAARLAARKR